MSYQSISDSLINGAGAYPSAPDMGIFSSGGGMVAPVDPWSTGIMAGSQILGSSLASDPKSSADAAFDNVFGFDNSGWNVSIGGGQITSDRTQTQPIVSNWMMTAGLIVAGLVAWKIYIKKR